jgi:hypothetical protein
MNDKLVTSLLATLLLCGGCGSDDADSEAPVTPPTVADSIDANQALAINLTLAEFDGASGALSFTLEDDAAVAITNAKDYRITYFGFPDEDSPSRKAKAWKRWHVTHSFECNSETAECEGILQESDKGRYNFDATGLNWDLNTADGSVQKYKVAIEIKGAMANNELILLPST